MQHHLDVHRCVVDLHFPSAHNHHRSRGTSYATTVSMRLEQGEQAYFKVCSEGEIVVKNSYISDQSADVALVPTNTECIVSGAAGSVLQVLEDSDRDRSKDIFEDLFGIRVKDLPDCDGPLYIDEKIREPVGTLGGARLSKPLRHPKNQVDWKAAILAFIRSQSRPPDYKDNLTQASVEDSLRRAFELASMRNYKSVVTVPFGTGMSNLSLEDAAEYMMPAILWALNSRRISIERVVITEAYPGKYLKFSSAVARLISKHRAHRG